MNLKMSSPPAINKDIDSVGGTARVFMSFVLYVCVYVCVGGCVFMRVRVIQNPLAH